MDFSDNSEKMEHSLFQERKLPYLFHQLGGTKEAI